MTSFAPPLAGLGALPAGLPFADAAPGALPAASGPAAYAWLLVAFPLLGAAILLIGGRRLDKIGPALATGLSWAAFAIGFPIWIQLLGLPAEQRAMPRQLFSWVPAGQFPLDAARQIAPPLVDLVLQGAL